MDRMDVVNINQLRKRLSSISKRTLDNQQTYYIVNKLLKVPVVKKGLYDWGAYFRMEDYGTVDRVLREYFNDTSQKIKPGKTVDVPAEPSMPDADMAHVSRELLKNDEVWFEENKRKIGRIIREELLKLC